MPSPATLRLRDRECELEALRPGALSRKARHHFTRLADAGDAALPALEAATMHVSLHTACPDTEPGATGDYARVEVAEGETPDLAALAEGPREIVAPPPEPVGIPENQKRAAERAIHDARMKRDEERMAAVRGPQPRTTRV